MGERALNINIAQNIQELFIKCGVNNIGILKSIVHEYCQICNIFETQKTNVLLKDMDKAKEALNKCYEEYFKPVSDRITNLARPKKAKKTSKAMRQRIICAILRIIKKEGVNEVIKGIPYENIQKELDKICKEKGIDKFLSSNVLQELGVLHTREENKSSKQNFIPLFYYDSHNKKLLILEPVLYMIKVYSEEGLEQLIASVY